jgi:hypothetical protein
MRLVRRVRQVQVRRVRVRQVQVRQMWDRSARMRPALPA